MNPKLALFSARRMKIGLIAVPLVLAAIYLYVFAADRYVSEATVTVRQANQESGSLPGVALMLGGLNPPSRDDTLYLRQFVHSMDLLKRLDAKLKLREHYEAERKDPFFRLYPGTSQEWFLDYYRSRVEVSFDDLSSLLTVRVQGFDPAFAHRLNQAILEESESFVNNFSHRMAREQMAFAQTELDRASSRLQKDKANLLAFQTKHKLLDPMAQAQAAGALTAELQASLAKQETELRTARSYLNEDSHPIKTLRSQIDATRAQLEIERLRATSGSSGERLNALAADFQELTLKTEFSLDTYKLALTALENARIEASRKIKSLVVIEPPTLPETAQYPRRFYNLVTLLIVSVLIYGIARLVVATVREHLD